MCVFLLPLKISVPILIVLLKRCVLNIFCSLFLSRGLLALVCICLFASKICFFWLVIKYVSPPTISHGESDYPDENL